MSSTPRIRLTQALYMLVLLLVATSGGRSLDGQAGLAAQAIGFILLTAGTLWRLWASVFIAGRKDVEIVDAGPYARCRHPLYLGSLVAALGLALSTRSLVLTLALPTLLAMIARRAIAREERFLADRHGDAWRDYASRVPLLWPGPGDSARSGPRQVNLAVYRKAFLDAAAMFGLWLLLVALEALRSQGAWAALFRLP